MYLAMYSGIRMFLEPLRTDSLMLFGLRVSQVLSIIIFIYSSITLLMRYTNLAIKRMYKIKNKKWRILSDEKVLQNMFFYWLCCSNVVFLKYTKEKKNSLKECV